ncbi:biopolymer transporter ExbD [Aureibaculum sp. 2210JD6-5]|uniref:ExbD/TolR family protein n=1 Tax=Aureibaculum sp. 2210JD6-5 TaxID=3103957 RepID=UPI002AAEC59E|nr:biopolymer transporter ExbD [Aureibaculum sp. 2210JD6-5]MDY7394440.1 biopolymer transporter ExbD [Aureibaculum sp. 2210JD6-5]
MSERNNPEINAGSMADIAFLLLIFFLVTTTMDTEIGIYKKLPEKQTDISRINVNEKNVLEINLNANDEILIEGDQTIDIRELKQIVVDFIDNGAGTNANGEKCTWCNGKKNETSSDHPEKAMIQFQTQRNSTYSIYISVQNEILSAYAELRNKLSQSLYGKNFNELKNEIEIDLVRKSYPQLLTEETPLK